MSRNLRSHLMLWASLLGICLTPTVHATQLSMALRQQGPLTAGRIDDGARMAVLYLTYHGAHAGFKVWSESPTPCMMETTGQHPPIRVRLENDGWKSEPDGNVGVTIPSTEDRVQLNVVADGEQMLPSGSWKLDLQAAVLAK